jgi:hypothetical protein
MSWGSKSSAGTNSSKSSISSRKFGLNEDDKSPILVYRYRSGSKALEVSSQHDLCKTLDKGDYRPSISALCVVANGGRPPTDRNLSTLRVSRKKIPRGNSRVEVRGEDLFPEEDRKRFSEAEDQPTLYRGTLMSSLANVGLPSSAYWKNLLFNSFPELYIISKSPSTTPNSSADNSPEASQHVTPRTTYPRESDHIAMQDHS